MGKSNKKAKSDRINALRKQYDVFLEEDKLRKERNEYILGRLDKMRYSSALVPLRHKPSTVDTRSAVINHLGYQSECPSVRDLSSCQTNQCRVFPDIKDNEEICLIQEISKKYILIPKLRSSLMNNYIQNMTLHQNKETVQDIHPSQDSIPTKHSKSNTNENTDWKSKYEILNILKNKEKQIKSFHTGYGDVSQLNVNNESFLGNDHEQVEIKCDNNIVTDTVAVDTARKYAKEFPEKDLPANTIHFEIKNKKEYSPRDIACANAIPNEITYHEDRKSFFKTDDQTDATDYQLQNDNLKYKELDTPKIGIPAEVANYESQPEYLKIDADFCAKQSVITNRENINDENEYPIIVDSAIRDHSIFVEQHNSVGSEPVVHLDENEISPMQVMHSDGLIKQINSPVGEEHNHVIEEEPSIEVNNVQEFRARQDVQIKTNVYLNPEGQMDKENIVDPTPQAEPIIEQIENPVDISESIEEFDAEQREMFYSEQTKENYPNQQSDVSALNVEFSQNEYQQNQDNAYYEGTQDEPYHVEVNDQEVTQRYDPIYEQQYVGLDQGLEQQDQQQYEQQDQQQYEQQDQQQYEQQDQQQYEQQDPQQYQASEESNQQQPKYEPLQFEQFESQAHIEEVLDVEDGYITQQHEVEGFEKQHVGEAIEKEQSIVEDETEMEKSYAEEIRTPEQMMG